MKTRHRDASTQPLNSDKMTCNCMSRRSRSGWRDYAVRARFLTYPNDDPDGHECLYGMQRRLTRTTSSTVARFIFRATSWYRRIVTVSLKFHRQHKNGLRLRPNGACKILQKRSDRAEVFDYFRGRDPPWWPAQAQVPHITGIAGISRDRRRDVPDRIPWGRASTVRLASHRRVCARRVC